MPPKSSSGLLLLLLLVAAPLSSAQSSTDEALARLKERQSNRSTTGPATRASTASTRPVSPKDAHRIVFLADDRPAIWTVFDLMRDELLLAVNNLRDDQLFTIIVMQPQAPKVFTQNLIRADRPAKANAADFIAAIGKQKSAYPISAIAKAVAMEPDLICLIASDDFPETDAVRRAFHPFHGRLNVVLFTPLVPHPNEFLRALAAEHGGQAIDQRGNVLEPPKQAPPNQKRKPESRPSVLDR